MRTMMMMFVMVVIAMVMVVIMMIVDVCSYAGCRSAAVYVGRTRRHLHVPTHANTDTQTHTHNNTHAYTHILPNSPQERAHLFPHGRGVVRS